MWNNQQIIDLYNQNSFALLIKNLNRKLLRETPRIKDYLEKCLLNRISISTENNKRTVQYPKLRKGRKEMVYFNQNQIQENVHQWVTQIRKQRRHSSQNHSKTNSILMYMNELPNISGIMSSLKGEGSNENTSKIMMNNSVTVNTGSQESFTNLMFTVKQICFENTTNSQKQREHDNKSIYFGNRFKVFIISMFNFENMVEEDPLIMFSDLDTFYPCKCNVNQDYSTPSDFSLEASSSRHISRFRIKQKSELDLNTLRITSIHKIKDLGNVGFESPRNMVKEIKKNFMDTPCLDQNTLHKDQRHLSLNPEALIQSKKEKLRIGRSSDFLIRRKSDFSKKSENSLKKEFVKDNDTSLIDHVNGFDCRCLRQAIESDFDEFWEDLIKQNRMGTLIGILIRAKVKVFKLDASILDE
jgi:hypothetical protein